MHHLKRVHPWLICCIKLRLALSDRPKLHFYTSKYKIQPFTVVQMLMVILTDRLTNMKSKPCEKDLIFPAKDIAEAPLPLKDLFDKLDEIKSVLEDDDNKLRGSFLSIFFQTNFELS